MAAPKFYVGMPDAEMSRDALHPRVELRRQGLHHRPDNSYYLYIGSQRGARASKLSCNAPAGAGPTYDLPTYWGALEPPTLADLPTYPKDVLLR